MYSTQLVHRDMGEKEIDSIVIPLAKQTRLGKKVVTDVYTFPGMEINRSFYFLAPVVFFTLLNELMMKILTKQDTRQPNVSYHGGVNNTSLIILGLPTLT